MNKKKKKALWTCHHLLQIEGKKKKNYIDKKEKRKRKRTHTYIKRHEIISEYK